MVNQIAIIYCLRVGICPRTGTGVHYLISCKYKEMRIPEVSDKTRTRYYQSPSAIKLNFENVMLTQVSAYKRGRKLFANHRLEFKHLSDLPPCKLQGLQAAGLLQCGDLKECWSLMGQAVWQNPVYPIACESADLQVGGDDTHFLF